MKRFITAAVVAALTATSLSLAAESRPSKLKGDLNVTGAFNAGSGGGGGSATTITSTGNSLTVTGTNPVNIEIPNTGVSAGSYTNINATVNSKGQITSISNGSSGGGSGGFGGDGSGGAITNPSYSSTVPQIFNATNFTQSSSATVQSGSVLNATGTFSMTTGTLTVNNVNPDGTGSQSYGGATVGEDGTGPAAGHGAKAASCGGGGAGGSTIGGAGGTATTGFDYLTRGQQLFIGNVPLHGSSGGTGAGSGSGQSGTSGCAGGGLRICAVGAVTLSGGTIQAKGGNANAGNANAGGSGGGSGGCIFIYSQTSITGTGSTLDVTGGNGADAAGGSTAGGGGGAGAPGFIVQMAPSITAGTLTLNGGSVGGGVGGGAGSNGAGASPGSAFSIVGKPTLPLIAVLENRYPSLLLSGARQLMSGAKEVVLSAKEESQCLAALENPSDFDNVCFQLINGDQLDGQGKVCQLGHADNSEALRNAS